MNAALVGIIRLLIVIQLSSKFQLTFAGTCWLAMGKNGRCTEALGKLSTKEECCRNHGVTTAWSPEEIDSGALFFWKILEGGVSCMPCKDSCNGVECSEDKNCVIKRGRPRCICSSHCRVSKMLPRGPICGTDGRSYRNVCRLRKRKCRHRSGTLSVAYNGLCQSSCDKIKCPTGKHCLLDQNLSPHCVRCIKKCPHNPKRKQVCGSDGVTYQSTCHLREKACRKGKAIPIAYKGPCKEGATCSKVRCKGQTCLRDLKTSRPRCVTCTHQCREKHLNGPVCGTNNSTYHSWCHMMQDACLKGYVIEAKHPGRCVSLQQKNPPKLF